MSNFELVSSIKKKRRDKIQFDETWASIESFDDNPVSKITNYVDKFYDYRASILPGLDHYGTIEYGRVADVLPPSESLVLGDSSYEEIKCERDYEPTFEIINEMESEVGTKFRGTTFYAPTKLWTKQQDAR